MMIITDGLEYITATSSKLVASAPGYKIRVLGFLHTVANSGYLQCTDTQNDNNCYKFSLHSSRCSKLLTPTLLLQILLKFQK